MFYFVVAHLRNNFCAQISTCVNIDTFQFYIVRNVQSNLRALVFYDDKLQEYSLDTLLTDIIFEYARSVVTVVKQFPFSIMEDWLTRLKLEVEKIEDISCFLVH